MSKITYPLIGITYNWKGLKEENYLYTAEELSAVDPKLYADCMANPDSWHDSEKAAAPDKTWMGRLIADEEMLSRFLKGDLNDLEQSEKDDEWYWECVMEDDLYGTSSDTLKNVVALLQVPENELRMN